MIKLSAFGEELVKISLLKETYQSASRLARTRANALSGATNAIPRGNPIKKVFSRSANRRVSQSDRFASKARGEPVKWRGEVDNAPGMYGRASAKTTRAAEKALEAAGSAPRTPTPTRVVPSRKTVKVYAD